MDIEKLYLRFQNEELTPVEIYEKVLAYYENMLKIETNDTTMKMIQNVHLLKSTLDSLLRNETIKQRVLELSKRQQPAQRTQGWYELRGGMFTASSDIGNITGSSFEHKQASNRRDIEHIEDLLILKKCGHDLKGFAGNYATRWGNMFEEVVTQIYSCKKSVEVLEFGLMRHDQYSFIGASPDGITPDGIMVEIKCPTSRKITGEVPKYYWTQIQTQLEACNLDDCDFVECKFKRFSSEAACINDKYSDMNGILGEYYRCTKNCSTEVCDCKNNPDNRHYCYPPLGAMNQQKEFIRNYQTNYKFLGFVYWGLQQYSCVRVKRDKPWFNEQLPKIQAAWEKVLYYRSNPEELEKLLKRAMAYEDEKNRGPSLTDCMTSSDESDS